MEEICTECREPIVYKDPVDQREGVCMYCALWLRQAHPSILSSPNTVRSEDHTHYTIGAEDVGRSIKGMHGRRFLIEFHDGRVVETTNLWYQGKIPEHFKDRLPPNAKISEVV